MTKIIEIFDRKVVEEQHLKALEAENRDEMILNEKKTRIENLKEELRHEITLFKRVEENELIKIIKNFFKSLHENNSEILNKA